MGRAGFVVLVFVLASCGRSGLYPPGDGAGPTSTPDPFTPYEVIFSIQNPPPVSIFDVPILLELTPDRVFYEVINTDWSNIALSYEGSPLPFEVEQWNHGGSSWLWTMLPAVDSSTTFSLHFGAGVTHNNRPTNVWAKDYNVVLHMENDLGPTPRIRDSSGGGNDGIPVGVATAGTASIGFAQSFDGNGDAVIVDQNSVAGVVDAVTIEVRALLGSQDLDFPHLLGAGSDGRVWQIFHDSDFGDWNARLIVDGNNSFAFAGQTQVGDWSYVALTFDGSSMRLYHDGEQLSGNPINNVSGTLDVVDTDLYIGSNPVLAPRDFTGIIDEFRVHRVSRPADWILFQSYVLEGNALAWGAPSMAKR